MWRRRSPLTQAFRLTTRYGIGFGLIAIPIGTDRTREVEVDECVLVRPDRCVAWRSMKIDPDCENKLLSVLNKIPSRDQIKLPNSQ